MKRRIGICSENRTWRGGRRDCRCPAARGEDAEIDEIEREGYLEFENGDGLEMIVLEI